MLMLQVAGKGYYSASHEVASLFAQVTAHGSRKLSSFGLHVGVRIIASTSQHATNCS
jgi:hypothetical protein